jgi:GT2 family glycosyltransferase
VTEIRYSCGLTDDIVRPALRFINSDGDWQETLMPAACEGIGIWRGRIPPGTQMIWICPAAREGRFQFRLEHVGSIGIATRLRFVLSAPKRAFFAASARWVGLQAEADLNQRWMYGRAETQNFGRWRILRAKLDEAPQAAANLAVLVLLKGGVAVEALIRSHASLVEQTHRNWRLCIVDPTPDEVAWLDGQADPRVIKDAARALEEEIGIAAFLRTGDEMVRHALSCVAAHFEAHPEQNVVYTDELRVGAEGAVHPVFKPDWSPVRQAWAPYVGRAVFVRGQRPIPTRGSIVSPEAVVEAVFARESIDSIGHIRRPLITVGGGDEHKPVRHRAASATLSGGAPKIGIVIPTRDRMDLLEPCLTSVLEKTSYRAFEIVVVDNDSSDPRTSEVLTRLSRKDSRLSVLPSPGPFNFSALCNRGAGIIDCAYLLFLNNDTEALDPEWLGNLLHFAAMPDIGAVGAKLLYPDATVQHAGVVLGMGGVAGHFGEGNEADAAGWLGGDNTPHEASAVTAACLMVARNKFDVVGGFDEVNLPVELSDVDLCLRLRQRGWRAICDCRTKLLHHQSASRGGGALRLQKVYQKEREYFLEKWRAVIRDDPYFNPNLSLYDYAPALG